MSPKALTPAYDNKIFQKYSKNTIKNKIENKLAFQEELGLVVDKKIPLLCVTIDLSDDKGAGLLEECVDGLLELPIQLLIVGVGTQKYQNLCSQIANQFKNKVRIISNTEEEKRKIFAASDIALVFSTGQEDLEEIKNYLSYGTVPILNHDLSKQLPLVNYNPIEEKGNCFTYNQKSKWQFFAAVVRATENYVFPYDWQNIQKNAMNTLEKKS